MVSAQPTLAVVISKVCLWVWVCVCYVCSLHPSEGVGVPRSQGVIPGTGKSEADGWEPRRLQ